MKNTDQHKDRVAAHCKAQADELRGIFEMKMIALAKHLKYESWNKSVGKTKMSDGPVNMAKLITSLRTPMQYQVYYN